MELEGKTILISGAGPGLGGACAAAALRDGANVIATARNLDRLQGAVAELDPGGERTLAMAADTLRGSARSARRCSACSACVPSQAVGSAIRGPV